MSVWTCPDCSARYDDRGHTPDEIGHFCQSIKHKGEWRPLKKGQRP